MTEKKKKWGGFRPKWRVPTGAAGQLNVTLGEACSSGVDKTGRGLQNTAQGVSDVKRFGGTSKRVQKEACRGD